jgi:hypothetical protein
MIAKRINFDGMAFVIIVVVLTMIGPTVVFKEVTAQNSAKSINATGGAANKTVVTVTGGKPNIAIGNRSTTTSTSTPSSSTASYNKTGFASLNVLTINGKNFPIKYSIRGGKLVGMLADKDRTTLVLVLNPGKDGGNMTIELPRNVIDSKGASNSDVKFQLKIDGKGVDYKEIANNINGRILGINFSKDNRFIEIIGTQMTTS